MKVAGKAIFQVLKESIKATALQVIPGIDHWRPVARPPALSPGETHLWKIHSGCGDAPLARLWLLLSRREAERAARLRSDRHRAHYVRTHAGLRMILSGYIGIEPEAIGFQYARAGKPLLEGAFPDLDFSLTTSGDLALAALSMDGPIGVDCEQISERRNILAIANRMFPPGQASRIAAATPKDRLRLFYIAWTALEARVKAEGCGLLGRNQSAIHESLQIRHCAPAPGFVAAVACERLPPVGAWITMVLSSG